MLGWGGEDDPEGGELSGGDLGLALQAEEERVSWRAGGDEHPAIERQD